jgi:hypothetical protein
MASTPGGALLLAYNDRLLQLDLGGAVHRVSAVSGFGEGDGGPARDARFTPLDVRSAPHGGVLVADAPDGPDGTAMRLRLLSPSPDPRRAWGVIERRTFGSLRRGVVVVRSGIGGRATVAVRRGREIVSGARVEIAAGTTALRISPTPPPGSYRVSLAVDGAAGSYSDRMTVVTLRRLSIARARRIAASVARRNQGGDDGGQYSERVDACGRSSPTRVDCRMITDYVIYDEDGNVSGGDSECGRLAITLAPDGLRHRFLGECAVPPEASQARNARRRDRLVARGRASAKPASSANDTSASMRSGRTIGT